MGLAASVLVSLGVTALSPIASAHARLVAPAPSGSHTRVSTPYSVGGGSGSQKYGQSWYVTTSDLGSMDTKAQSDATWASSNCQASGQEFMSILDFGQPTMYNGSYATYLPGNNNTFVTDSQIVSLAEEYARVWFNDSSSCPALRLVIGTNNFHECPGGGSCDVTTAGSQWFSVIQSVGQYVQSNGWAWQLAVLGGDDIEGGWDQFGCPCAPAESWQQTQYFLHGLANAEVGSSFQPNFVDYGDAALDSVTLQERASSICSNNSCEWSPSDFYQASWAIGWDIPVPEIYYHGQAVDWSNVTNAGTSSGPVQYYGVVTECSGANILPEPSCYVSGNNDYENGPDQALSDLQSTTGATFAQSNETNIKWP